MTSIAPLEKRLDSLAAWAKPRTHPTPLAVTPEEVERVAAIMNRADDGQEPGPEDLAFLEEMLSRPEIEIDHSQPTCFSCGGQPARERGNPPSQPICESCFKHMCGLAYDR